MLQFACVEDLRREVYMDTLFATCVGEETASWNVVGLLPQILDLPIPILRCNCLRGRFCVASWGSLRALRAIPDSACETSNLPHQGHFT